MTHHLDNNLDDNPPKASITSTAAAPIDTNTAPAAHSQTVRADNGQSSTANISAVPATHSNSANQLRVITLLPQVALLLLFCALLLMSIQSLIPANSTPTAISTALISIASLLILISQFAQL